MAHERLRYCAGKACDCHAKAPLGFGVVSEGYSLCRPETERKSQGRGPPRSRTPWRHLERGKKRSGFWPSANVFHVEQKVRGDSVGEMGGVPLLGGAASACPIDFL